MRSVTLMLLLAILPIVVASNAGAADRVASNPVTNVMNTGAAASAATLYAHNDCVGPGLPLTAAPHVSHTTHVTGFVISGTRTTFSLNTISFFGAGICPTALGGPVLPQDFTGTWHVTAVCREGTTTPGQVSLDWSISVVAGALPVSQGLAGLGCSGFLGSAYAMDVTIELSSVTFLGVTAPPTGGVALTVTQ